MVGALLLTGVIVSVFVVISTFILSQPPPVLLPAVEFELRNDDGYLSITHQRGDNFDLFDEVSSNTDASTFYVKVDGKQWKIIRESDPEPNAQDAPYTFRLIKSSSASPYDNLFSVGDTLVAIQPVTVTNPQVQFISKGFDGSERLLWGKYRSPQTSPSCGDYYITANSGPGGRISPSGTICVVRGTDKEFIFTPHSGYLIDYVLVDGVPIGAVSSYTFNNIVASHTIYVGFRKNECTKIITVTVDGDGGTITPGTDQTIYCGETIVFYVRADSGSKILNLWVNGVVISEATNEIRYDYTFSNVNDDQSIRVEFTGGDPTPTPTPTPCPSVTASLSSNVSSGPAPLSVQFTDTSTSSADITGWQWNFGDGSGNSTVKNPVHTFTSVGTFIVTLTSTNDCGESSSVSYSITSTCPPVFAGFSSNVSSGPAPLSVQFTDTSTSSAGITGWQWNFGDGSGNSTVQNPVHMFTSVGTFIVTLTSTNDCGESSSVSYSITSTCPPVFAGFSSNVSSGPAPLSVQFTDTSTSSAGITGWQWNFGDGSGNATVKNPVHTFTSVGTFIVTLTPTNDCGESSSVSYSITSTCPPVVAGFSSNVSSGYAPLTVQFADTSTSSADITGWQWNFGDGSGNSTVKNPVHTFTSAGTFIVTLTSTNSCGQFSSVSYSVIVSSCQVTITASAGTGGSITPTGSVSVTCGASQTFTITPATGYAILDVLVNGASVGQVSSYTFTNVQSSQTIQAFFTTSNPCYTISGRITNVNSGDPVAGIRVNAYYLDNPTYILSYAVCAPDGYYTLHLPLPPPPLKRDYIVYCPDSLHWQTTVPTTKKYTDIEINPGGGAKCDITGINFQGIPHSSIFDNVFVYGNTLSFSGNSVSGPGTTVVITGGLNTDNTNLGASIAVTTIYIDGDVDLAFGSAGLGSSTEPGNIYINGDLRLWNGARDIYGDVYVNGDFDLKDARIHGNVYVNGNLTLGWTPSLADNTRIYYTGSITHPPNYDLEILQKCIYQVTVPICTMPDEGIPPTKPADWYATRGYVSGGTLTSNLKIFADSYSSTTWRPTATNVIIVARTGDITITGLGGSGVTGVFFAPNGKVTLGGGFLEGVVIARDGFYVPTGGTTVTFKNMDQYISDPNDYPF
jgi:PKD repeat protein